MPGHGQGAFEHEVAVQDGAGGVGHGVVVVVPVHEHGVDPGDGAAAVRAGAFEQLRQQGEGGGRVAARGGGLAGGQADLPLGHGHAGQGVHHQHGVAAGVPEVLGDPGGGEGGLAAHHGGLVAGGDHHHGAGQPLGAEVVLEEAADLAAALAHQGDDGDLGVGAARDHGQQGGLAHPGAGEQADALAAAEGGEGVHGAHAGAQLGVDGVPLQGVRRGPVHAGELHAGDRPLAVEGPAQGVHHPADQSVPHGHLPAPVGAQHGGAGGRRPAVRQGHHGGLGAVHGDHLGLHRARSGAHGHHVTDGHGEPADGGLQSLRGDHGAVGHGRGQPADRLDVPVQAGGEVLG